MRANLQAQNLWHVVDPGDADYSEDCLALAAILRVVPLEMLLSLAIKESAHDAWEAIKIVQLGVQRVRTANTQKLCKEFNDIAFKPGEMVDDFAMRLSRLVNNIRLLGDDIDEEEVVRKMLQVAPERFDQVVISIESLLAIKDMFIEGDRPPMHGRATNGGSSAGHGEGRRPPSLGAGGGADHPLMQARHLT